jgi:thiaminase/transcriptional activator TenA
VTGAGVRALASAAEPWRSATSHPFLDAVRDGTLPTRAFDRWLEQDRLFVTSLARAWGLVLAGAPAEHLPLLADGIAAFVGEIGWFDDLADERGLDRSPAALPATARYHEHLLEMASEPFPAAMAAMWAVEAAYLEAWRSTLPGAPAYRAFVEHWTGPNFAGFVDRIEMAVDDALATASPIVREQAAGAVRATVRHEADFWAMTWS